MYKEIKSNNKQNEFSVQVRPSTAVLVPRVARWSKLMLLSTQTHFKYWSCHRHFDYLHVCLEICQTAPGSQWGSIIYFIINQSVLCIIAKVLGDAFAALITHLAF